MLYAFVAITPSSSTLDGLIEMIGSDNNRIQRQIDAGLPAVRFLNVNFHRGAPLSAWDADFFLS